jgi:hypothetical protein
MTRKSQATAKPKRRKAAGLQKSARGRGRPVSVGGKPIIAKMPPALVEAIEAWGDRHGTNRSDAMRQLIEVGLKHAPKAPQLIERGLKAKG